MLAIHKPKKKTGSPRVTRNCLHIGTSLLRMVVSNHAWEWIEGVTFADNRRLFHGKLESFLQAHMTGKVVRGLDIPLSRHFIANAEPQALWVSDKDVCPIHLTGKPSALSPVYWKIENLPHSKTSKVLI
jgi:hypothetical protein